MRLNLLLLIALIAFPFIAMWLTDFLGNLVPLLAHQLYYLPVSWLGEPFFRADGDLGFWPNTSGRVLAAIAYPVILATGVWSVQRVMRWRGR